MAEPQKLADLIGARCRELRVAGGFTLEEVANAMRTRGFRWSISRVAELEAGKVAPLVSTLVALVATFNELHEGMIVEGVRGLLPTGTQVIEIAPGVRVVAEEFAAVLAGEPRSLITSGMSERLRQLMVDASDTSEYAWLRGSGWSQRKLDAITVNSDLVDERAARALEIPLPAMQTIALALWGRTLSYERDSRRGEDANPQEIGRITRALVEEARAYLDARRQETSDA